MNPWIFPIILTIVMWAIAFVGTMLIATSKDEESSFGELVVVSLVVFALFIAPCLFWAWVVAGLLS